MKCFIAILLIYFSFNALVAQTFVDIAPSQNIIFIEDLPNGYGTGMSFYDFDEDGWDDLTFPTNTDSIVFYRNNNGVFEKIDSYILALGEVRQITWVDYDNDTDLDISIAYDDVGFSLHQNDGNFNFTNVTATAGITTAPFMAYGFTFSDPDGDGDLDLYLCSHEIPQVFIAPLANMYYENQGNGTFIEKAQMFGIDNGTQPSFMPAWFDYDNDSDLDLAIINDKEYWADALYTNLGGGVYHDTAFASGFDNNGHNPMSLSVADYDNDGYQDVFKTDVGSDVTINSIALDHKLYHNNAGVDFTDMAQGSGLDTNIFAWGALWVDFNNDCFEDIAIATALGLGTESLLFRNNAGSSFTLMNDSITGSLAHTSMTPVKGDINNDGFYDIVVLNYMANPNVLLNSGNNNHFIKLDLLGIDNKHGIGSKIEVYANGEHQTQTAFCGSGLCAQNSQHKIFGLGNALSADSVIVTFPTGNVTRLYDLPADSNYLVREQILQTVDYYAGVDTVLACPGEQFTVGMNGYYNYEWSDGSQTPTITVQSSGLYSFQATNQAQDTLYVSNAVYFDFEPNITTFESITDPGCGAAADGWVALTVTPASAVDAINWSNGATGYLVDSLAAGTYSYTITTMNGCVYTQNLTIQSTPVFTSQVLTTPVTDTTFGTAQFYMWGGVTPYLFILDGDTVTNPISDLNAGNYDIVIVDASGCMDTVAFTIGNQSTASLEDLEHKQVHAFYAQGKISISLVQDDALRSVSVYNLLGELVLQHNVGETQSVNHQYTAQFSNQAAGTYRVIIHCESGVYAVPITVY